MSGSPRPSLLKLVQGLVPCGNKRLSLYEVGAGKDNSVALGLAQLLGGQDGIQQALGLFIKKERGLAGLLFVGKQ